MEKRALPTEFYLAVQLSFYFAQHAITNKMINVRSSRIHLYKYKYYKGVGRMMDVVDGVHW
jgi:hypothetical protein